MYGTQCWTLRKTEEKRLAVFERKVLRKIYGPIYEQDLQGWRKRHNQELTELFNRPNIINEIKRKNPKRKRPLGRPRLRWEDGIKKDFLSAGGAEYDDMDWKEVAENRDERERVCSMAR
ncbi:PRE C2HC domain-containing protein [Aphis craccivora]|uniref:PRE C2HC domain-containing protein n=1 Tax=Aphis craccivora TaxID=307492 RepID=A0A6G0YX84_APHCR|nr:PRE C2HC domain-containing protein [Aphis craccivora]